eukprot:CAMPEP_0183305912 /NCGR_PEP_ID=MMETSP0160_2-20130417/10501_1 /TAXON_ID=2839 ORGANISM="Odontella Sinensis, Strain Grunow 1884" /NCGR_SAMPLE_ID=MMETSP0160_2 /ASSEMBLY_ACC=CAM_ASM_000250 /LENGTH=662 /DNA_ID=CAMNT_0025469189 /DNA_START=43 /DNA_END=2031 /DNA_ORIENTATION=+
MASSSVAYMTVGQRLDSFIESIDPSLSPTTKLYACVVCASVGFSFLLLNGRGSNVGGPDASGGPKSASKNESSSSGPSRRSGGGVSAASASSGGGRREPKWGVLKALNVVAALAFLISVIRFASDASRHMSDSTSLLKFMSIWSALLCYFFGFFGISFVDAEGFSVAGEETKTTEKTTKKAAGEEEDDDEDGGPGKKTAPAGSRSIPEKPQHANLHPPAPSAPVCSDPTSRAPITKKALPPNLQGMPDNEIAALVLSGVVKDHQLEKLLSPARAVPVRRIVFERKLSSLNRGGALDELPHEPSLDYGRVHGANCEIVVGYVPLPCGVIGPLTLDGETVYVPMATTEGCLVASANRGCKAISQGGGARSAVIRDGITRAPCVRMRSAMEAAELKLWCEDPANFARLKSAFESTTSFGKLLGAHPTVAGRNVYLRLRCFSGDAMGMNMVSKGSLAVIELLRSTFPSLELVALSGNMCTDKKAAATNWIEGRGKSVVVEATIPKDVVRATLKTTVPAMVNTNLQKNLVGSAMAGALGGFNAHAANIVTAIFLATGQDPAQNVESSNCITLLEETPTGDLWISCTMPSVEVGTVGGGTGLPAQASCLRAIGCKGGGANPGDNARKLARVVAASVLAGELSLLAALAANTLVQAHMIHNRKKPTAGK